MILLAIGGDFGRRDLGDERFAVFRCNEAGWELDLNPESSLPLLNNKITSLPNPDSTASSLDPLLVADALQLRRSPKPSK